MSEHLEPTAWEYYRGDIDGSHAFVYYDPSFGEHEAFSALRRLLRLRVRLNTRDQDGIASAGEMPALSAIEEELRNFSEQHNAAYVGRITVDGYMHFFCYTDLVEAELGELSESAQLHGYRLEYVLQDDPELSCYFDEICPEPSPQTALDATVLKRTGRG